jgi:hypothetical protein
MQYEPGETSEQHSVLREWAPSDAVLLGVENIASVCAPSYGTL